MRGSIERVIAALNAAHVRYLVVGGVAVVLHGYLRTTADLELVVQLQPDILQRALQAIHSIGYRPRLPVSADQLADPAVRHQWRTENLDDAAALRALAARSEPDDELG